MLLAAAAAFAGAAMQSATGFGFALVLSPALFAVLEPHEAVSASLALGLPLNLLVLGDAGPARVHWRALLPMLCAALPGLFLGALALELLPKPALQMMVGAAVLAAALWQLGRGRSRRMRAPLEPTLGGAAGVGLASGALTTSISISGPPIVLWLEAQRLRPAQVRASLAAAFLVLNLTGGTVILLSGGGEAVEPSVLLPLLALVVLGHMAGARAFRRLDQRRFSRLVLLLVGLAGLASLGAGLEAAL